jgi:transposase
LTEPQWQWLKLLLPPEKPATGRPNHDHRRMVEGMLWIDRTGAPWRDMPACFGPWSSVASRFYRWCEQGLWQQILRLIQQEADAAGDVAWDTHHVDTTTRRAHQHAAGGHKGTATQEALGDSRGGMSTKLHLRVDSSGKPMTWVLTPGQQHESTVFTALLDQGAVARRAGGPPRLHPQRVVGDKGYSSRTNRQYLRRKGIQCTIARRRDERRRGPFNRAAYRQRNVVERAIRRLKQFRRVVTRYEKRAAHFEAMVTLAVVTLWL